MLSGKHGGISALGDFDENIQRCKEWRAQAVQRLSDLESGERRFVNGIEVTEQRKKRERQIIEQMDTLIPAYEAHNADRP
jgi:hypothetical protein